MSSCAQKRSPSPETSPGRRRNGARGWRTWRTTSAPPGWHPIHGACCSPGSRRVVPMHGATAHQVIRRRNGLLFLTKEVRDGDRSRHTARTDNRREFPGSAHARVPGSTRPQLRGRRSRRRRILSAQLLRFGRGHAEHRPAGRRRPALQPLPRHGSLFSHSGLVDHRAKPSRRRDGFRSRRADADAGLHRTDPENGSDHGEAPA